MCGKEHIIYDRARTEKFYKEARTDKEKREPWRTARGQGTGALALQEFRPERVKATCALAVPVCRLPVEKSAGYIYTAVLKTARNEDEQRRRQE